MAGSLGTFGLEQAACRALEAESLLRQPDPDARRLAESVESLRRLVERGAPVDAAPPNPETPREPMTTLLAVTSDPELASLIVADCGACGLSAEIVADTAAAQRLLDEQGFDAVLVAMDATRGTRGSGKMEELGDLPARVPTFVMSESEDLVDRLEAVRAGAVGFMPRRQSVRNTLAFITQVLRQRKPQTSVVLAVDDDPILLDLIRAVLEGPECGVVTVDDPLAFWTTLEQTQPTLVLTDVDMPGLTGFELCRLVRADPRWHQLPILALTNRNDSDTLRRAFEAGADDFVGKPIEEWELRARVHAHVERTSLLRMIADIDPLTGAENQGVAQRSVDRLIRLAARHSNALTVALIRFDLQVMNEHEGSVLANVVLHRLGEILRKSLRGEDIVGRWNDDEFIVGLYGAEPEPAFERIAKLVELIGAEAVLGPTGHAVPITCHAGLSSFPIDGTSVDTLVWAAENALQDAARERITVGSTARLGRDKASGRYDVIIVDDDVCVADLIAQALQLRGLRVHRLTDGAEAAELLTDGSLSARVLLLDVGLPGLDGFGVLRALGDAGILAESAVIMLTARSSVAETLLALELGATEHITKPFSLAVLLRRIEQVLDASSGDA